MLSQNLIGYYLATLLHTYMLTSPVADTPFMLILVTNLTVGGSSG